MYKLDTHSAKPPYLQVKEMLYDEIQSGRATPGSALPKETDLAHQLGLSRMTVRRAIVELAEEGLVRRVRGQGTFVQPGARAVARRNAVDAARLQSIAVVNPTPIDRIQHSMFYHRLLQGIQDATSARNATLALRGVDEPAARLASGLSREAGLDGVVAFGITDRALVNALAGCAIPTVLVDCVDPAKSKAANVGTVRAECESSAHRAATHLARLGHADVGVLSFEGETEVVASRREGFTRAMREAGHAIPKRRTYPTNISVEGGYATARRIIDSGDVPTALLCCADEMALGAIAAAQEHGMRVPRDLSVVGFGDIGYFSAPPLSTVRIPVEQMGATAVELLAERAADAKARPRSVTLPSEWLLRSTCDVPRRSRTVKGDAR